MIGNVCASCGGRVEFSPDDSNLKCVKCGNIYPIEKNQAITKHEVKGDSQQGIKKWLSLNKAYKCGNCGAEVIMGDFDISNVCQYCNATTLVPEEKLTGLKPEKVVPFKISKQQAKATFNKNVVKRHFIPSNFKKKLPSTNIGATYISSFVFSCNVFATYKVVVREEERIRNKDGTTRTLTHYRHFSGQISKAFNNLVVEASDKLNQSDIRGVFPFNFDECYDYDDDFIKGYNVGYYNKSVEDAEREAKSDALDSIKKDVEWKYNNVVSVDVFPTYSNMRYNYTLLPLYFITFNYKDKNYVNVMNGQTGKFSGKLPRSAGKITWFTIMIILICLGVAWLVFGFM